eukprot:scaffold2357_cov399-Prasinococcus_capsulatus_cf.AAC.22
MTLHIRQLEGENSHHIIEATFKVCLGPRCAVAGHLLVLFDVPLKLTLVVAARFLVQRVFLPNNSSTLGILDWRLGRVYDTSCPVVLNVTVRMSTLLKAFYTV